MPQIAPDTWRVGYEFSWYREYQDGRIEYQFDPGTGQQMCWGQETPKGLERVGWLPMTPDLAAKIRSSGETGYPVHAFPVAIKVNPGDRLICARDCTILDGSLITCKVCGFEFRTLDQPNICPDCGTEVARRCEGALKTVRECEGCTKQCSAEVVSPFIARPDRREDAVYILGIEGRYEQKFNSRGMITE